jgi:homoserine acetyltransferase
MWRSCMRMFGEKNWTNVVRNTAALMYDLGNGGGLVEDDFKTIKTDVLILRGSEDKMVTSESSQEVASWLENGIYLEIDAANHIHWRRWIWMFWYMRSSDIVV